MNLEDHIGDVIRKARLMSRVSAASAAREAGLTEPELEEFEKSGRVGLRVNFVDLAELIGLDARKLAELAAGWLPSEKDLTRWRELRRIGTSANGITVNCYLVWDEVSREAALFDTGWE